MRYIYLLVISSCSLFFSCNSSCLTKDSFVANFDEFVEASTQRHQSDGDKTNTEKTFDSYTSECYEKFQTEMTNEEKVHFWKQTIRFKSHLYDYSSLDQLLSPELQESLERDLETFTREGKEELVKIFRDEIAPDLNNAIDDVVKGIEEIGESLKGWLKEIEKE